MRKKSISVIGSGQMGSGIAQVFAMHGYSLCLYDNDESSLKKAKLVISKSLHKLAEKNIIENKK